MEVSGMSEFRNAALKKIQGEFKNGKFDRYGNAMKTDVLRQLEDFIEQDDEFAQAVAQGGSFEDCMEAVAKSVGGSISDLEAYQRAVQFYFPGAKVKMQLTIDLIGDAAEAPEKAREPEKKPENIVLDFRSFL
jgi:hypothetical protein